MDKNYNDPAYGRMLFNSASTKNNNVNNKVDNSNNKESDVNDIITLRKQKQIKIIAVLLFIFSVLLVIALISYTSKDEPNTTISLHEILDIMKGNAVARAKFETTQNWLGLIGAILSNFFYNYTIGISIIFFPVYIIFYAISLYKNFKISDKLIKNTIIYLLLAFLLSGFFGTLQRTSYFNFIPKEFSGVIGQFISSVISNFIGAIGAILLFVTGIVLAVILGTDIKFVMIYGLVIFKVKHIASVVYKYFHRIFLTREPDTQKPIVSFESNIDNEPVNKENKYKEDKNKFQKPVMQTTEFVNNELEDKPIETEHLKNKSKFSFFKKKNNIKDNSTVLEKDTNNDLVEEPFHEDEELHNFLKDSPQLENNDSARLIIKSINSNQNNITNNQTHPLFNDSLNSPYPNSQNDEYLDYNVHEEDNIINENQEVNKNKRVIDFPLNKFPDSNNETNNNILKSTKNKIFEIVEFDDGNDFIDELDIDSELENESDNDINYLKAKTSDFAVEHNNLISDSFPPDDVEHNNIITTDNNDEFKELDEAYSAPNSIAKPNDNIYLNNQKDLNLTINKNAHNRELIFPISTRIHDEEIDYNPPPYSFLIEEENVLTEIDEEELAINARILQEKLETFKINIENLTITPGPVVTQYEFVPAAGIKISKIESLADDIAMALKAKGIRIIAPVPGKGTVGIEIPNKHPMLVRFSSIVASEEYQNTNFNLPIALGKNIAGDVVCTDLAKMPHILIAGSTGSGKSVGINTFIMSLLYKMKPNELKLVIIDPKKVELSQYAGLANHFLAISPDVKDAIITNPDDAVTVLKALCTEMENRYTVLAKVGQRNIFEYNEKVKSGKLDKDKEIAHRQMPFIVVVVDELADLMLTAGKDVEFPITRLAQLARAVGIHLILATQRPSVDVITGLIKANFPARIAYLVATKIDSRTILDGSGAEQLLGNGDMLFQPSGSPKPIRIQSPFITTDEVEDICNYIAGQDGYSEPYFLPTLRETSNNNGGISREDRDPMFEDAARLIIQHQQGSVSLVQRRLKVGYARAGRIVDELEAAGVVGPFDGSKARQVLMTNEADLEDVL